MENQTISSIPQLLLARILLQLLVIPHRLVKHGHFDLLAIIAAGLQEYGSTSDLDAFLEFCTNRAVASIQDPAPFEWLWTSSKLNHINDWDHVRGAAESVGLRLYLVSEETRKMTGLCFGNARPDDARFIYTYKNHSVARDAVLSGTLSYLEQTPTLIDNMPGKQALKSLARFHLDRLAREHEEHERQHIDNNTNFILMGALMIDYRAQSSSNAPPEAWCLYLRDYIESASGSNWRILHAVNANDTEKRIPSDQALADIRGCTFNDTKPTLDSSGYRPVCLFYCNERIIQEAVNGPPSDDQVVTLEDYSFEDDEGFDEEMTDILDAACKHCFLAESVDDVNTIYICDECNFGVHQLCENPPIASEESEIDPWYCRECSARMGLLLPSFDTTSNINKRKRDETEEHNADS